MSCRDSLRIALVVAALAAAGCGRPSPTAPWPPNTDPVVFDDTFGARVGFQAFLGSKLDAVAVDSTEKHSGTASIRVTVPAPGTAGGGYAGGAFVAGTPRDLSGYNALSLWVRASRAVNLEVVGLGNDNTGTSRHEARRTNLPVTTDWAQVLIPIPLPQKLAVEKGLFFFAEGPQAGQGLTLWFDDVRFVNVSTVSNPRPFLARQTLNLVAGATASLANATRTVFSINGLDQNVAHMPGYFTFATTNGSVAGVEGAFIRARGTGTAKISAKLGPIAAADSITVNAVAPPASAAPNPTLPAADVTSLFSNAYTNVPVDTWSAVWDVADVSEIAINGNATKVYSNLTFAGVEFTSNPIDATAMNAFHIDVFAPAGSTFRVKLVDFGPNGVFGPSGAGNDDSEHELTFNASSAPAFATNQWVSIDVPLPSFTGLAARAHLAQLVLSGDTRNLYVDNVFFHR